MVDPLSDTLTARDLGSLLAPTLGWEKSVSLVVDTARAMGYRADWLSRADGIAILTQLGREKNIVGVAARFACARFEAPTGASAAPSSRSAAGRDAPEAPAGDAISSGVEPRSNVADTAAAAPESAPAQASGPAAVPRSGVLLPLRTLAEFLAQTIGLEKAEATLVETAQRMGLPVDRLDRDQAARLLEDLSQREGLVGISARFAKARMLLKFSPAR